MIRSTAVVCLIAVAASGCSSLVQVPRAEFAAQTVRRNVWIRTQTGEQYAFERAEFTADSLLGTGFQEKTLLQADGQPQLEEISSAIRLPLDQVSSLAEKRRSWGRTAKWGLGVAGAAAFVVAVGSNKPAGEDAAPGGGKGAPDL